MSSDAEILALRAPGKQEPDPRRWAALAVFTAYEPAKARGSGSPLVELRMFRQRGFAVGMAIALVFFMGIASFGLVLTLFLQAGLGFSSLHAGLTFVPFSLGVFVSSGAAARLEPKFGPRVTMAGALLIAAGMATLIGILHQYGAAVSTWDMVPALTLAGLGLGTVIAPLANVVLAGVPSRTPGPGQACSTPASSSAARSGWR